MYTFLNSKLGQVLQRLSDLRNRDQLAHFACLSRMVIHSLLNVVQQGPKFCTSLLPESSHPSLYAALICGSFVTDENARRLFLDTGLIHILVVSGAHLSFLENRIAFLPASFRIFALGVYCWCTGFGAPVTKALVRRLLEAKLAPLGWTGVQCEAAAVVLLLWMIPEWLVSRSFLMSWMCALAFSLPPILPIFDKCAKAYVLLFAFVAASPLTILWNAALAPLIGEVLFPLCLLVIPFPFLVPLTDRMWTALLGVLEFGPVHESLEWFAPASQLFWIPIFVHLGILLWEVRWRRARAFVLP
jgi:hypothetical protein